MNLNEELKGCKRGLHNYKIWKSIVETRFEQKSKDNHSTGKGYQMNNETRQNMLHA